MVKCPRCQNSVDERQRASCPVCFTLLSSSYAQPGANLPGFTPLPPGTVASPVPPPTGGYAPPPGSPYHFPPLPGAAPSPSVPPQGAPSVPGYAPATYTRTTLTGEVVETTPPPPASTPPYVQGRYTAPPVAVPYGSSNGYEPPAFPAPNKFWSAMNWRVAGGGGVAVVYVGVRLLLIVLRYMHPMHSFTPVNDYRTMPLQYSYPTTPQVYPSGSVQPPTTYQYTPPNLPQPRIYTPPNFPNPTNFPSHFRHPNMPGMPNLPGPPNSFSGQ